LYARGGGIPNRPHRKKADMGIGLRGVSSYLQGTPHSQRRTQRAADIYAPTPHKKPPHVFVTKDGSGSPAHNSAKRLGLYSAPNFPVGRSEVVTSL